MLLHVPSASSADSGARSGTAGGGVRQPAQAPAAMALTQRGALQRRAELGGNQRDGRRALRRRHVRALALRQVLTAAASAAVRAADRLPGGRRQRRHEAAAFAAKVLCRIA